ncbi:MAG: hypothetical protein GEU78_18645, partial [Actinobacteria bacterium]|nr:hypothetical protein [Actinomycetota bacterium]
MRPGRPKRDGGSPGRLGVDRILGKVDLGEVWALASVGRKAAPLGPFPKARDPEGGAMQFDKSQIVDFLNSQ